MKLFHRVFVGSLLFAGAWQSVLAQEPTCTKDDTLAGCTQRLQDFLNAEKPEAEKLVDEKQGQASEIESNLSSALAGMNTGDASAPTISDFLPLFRLLLDTGASTEDLPDKIGVEWNNPLPISRTHQHKLAVALVKGEMFAPLKESMQAAGFGDQATNLADDIDQGDDVRLTLSYSPASESWGRDPDLDANHELLSKVLHAVSQRELDSEATAAMLAAQEAREEFIRVQRLEALVKAQTRDGALIGNIEDEAVRTKYIELTVEQRLATFRSVQSLAASLRDANFYRAIDLVNNQPQLVATAEYNARDEVTGPDQVILRFSYESGGPNLKKFRKHRDSKCKDKKEIVCLAEYLEQKDVKRALENGSIRFKVYGEYVKHQRMEFALADTAYTYVAEPIEQLTISAGVGGYFGRELVGKKRARFDAIASYEDFSDDPLRQDRGVATVSVTYPISEGFFLSVGAVYATKPEFRGDVDEEISARAGFTYKILEDK